MRFGMGAGRPGMPRATAHFAFSFLPFSSGFGIRNRSVRAATVRERLLPLANAPGSDTERLPGFEFRIWPRPRRSAPPQRCAPALSQNAPQFYPRKLVVLARKLTVLDQKVASSDQKVGSFRQNPPVFPFFATHYPLSTTHYPVPSMHHQLSTTPHPTESSHFRPKKSPVSNRNPTVFGDFATSLRTYRNVGEKKFHS